MQQYVSKFADQYSKTVASMTPSQKQFLMQAVADIKAKFQSSGRTKRQTHLIVRREIRMLSPEERADYFWAVNALKMDTVRCVCVLFNLVHWTPITQNTCLSRNNYGIYLDIIRERN